MPSTIARLVLLLVALTACTSAPTPRADTARAGSPGERDAVVPAADHHQHLFSPATAALIGGEFKPISARELVALLDSAGIRRAVVASTAYLYASASRNLEDEYAKLRADNDWTSAQVGQYPDRLRGFCGVNPLEDYALDEIARCGRDPNLRGGLKMHLGNADVQLENPAHVEQLRRVFRAANAQRMTILVHARANIGRKRPYGAEQARVFLRELMPLVPDVDVQVAHMAGTGPGYDDPPADSAMAVLADAVQRREPHTGRLFFDVASNAHPENPAASTERLVQRIRRVGVDRILFGSDGATAGNMKPREAWAAFRALPLTDDELTRIAGNVAPYLR